MGKKIKKLEGVLGKYELYKRFIEKSVKTNKAPLIREEEVEAFLKARYGNVIYGKRTEQISPERKYWVAQHEAREIMRDLSLDPLREMLLERILQVKKEPNNAELYRRITRMAERASQPDLIEALGEAATSLT